jgi:hypothetical protein
MPGKDPVLVTAAPTLAVDVPRAAVMIGANASDVRGWIASGLLPCVKFPSTRRPGEPSRRILIAVADLEEFVRRHRDTAPEPNAALSQAAVRRWRERAAS